MVRYCRRSCAMRKRLIREKTMSFTTHFSIVGHLKEEEDSSWERFFQTYGPLIRMHGKDCGVPEGALDDLVQNVMLSVFKQSKRFEYDPARGRFRDYLRMIIRARANDFFRELYREERAVRAVPEMECQLDNLYAAEWEEHVRRESLKKLREISSARHFQIFHMAVIQNRDPKELAAFFRMPRATLYSIRSRMEAKLREIARSLNV